MGSFNVLDPELDLSHHYLLEASAGTGKTYSIENIILRLLLEENDPLSLEQILAVTFTRAAVADMRMRVRENLRRTLEVCKKYLQGEEFAGVPDFLRVAFSFGADAVASIKRRLEAALGAFDCVCIYTIHSFCARMLRENMLEGDHLAGPHTGEHDHSSEFLQKIAKDFLRTELHTELVNAVQLEIVLDCYRDFEGLVRALAASIASIVPVEPALPYEKSFQAFLKQWEALKKFYPVDGRFLLCDFLVQAPFYKDVCNKRKEIHSKHVTAAERFTALFDKELPDRDDFDFLIGEKGFWNVVLAEKFKKFPSLELRYPDFSLYYEEYVGPIIKAAADPQAIFSVMAAGCQQLGQRILKENDQLGFNTLLKAMAEACQNPSFAANVRSRFKAVIIDEFQDTDPLQWEIFRVLFPPSDHQWGRLFLVGDPKQSIYSFRQADIYTYLSASQEIDCRWKARLDRNFRSEPSLVHALNTLFDPSFAANFIPLPRLASHVEYVPVTPGGTVEDLGFDDGRGSLHAYIVTKEGYNIEEIDCEVFPLIAYEMSRLYSQKQVKFTQFAVLVADRFQAARLIDYLRTWNIPAVYQRAASLSESKAVKAMRELLVAVMNPRNESNLKIAMGGPVIGWTHQRLRTLESTENLQRVLELFFTLRELLWTEGFPRFITAFMQYVWDESGDDVEKGMLAREGGGAFYNEWLHVCDWLVENHSHSRALPGQLIDELLELEANTEDRQELKIQTSVDDDAVQVLTIHSSKGLEFDFVFPVGLYKRDRKPSTLIPIPDGKGGYFQKAVDEGSQEYIDYCEESNAEKMRQLYVAMTRAKHRLYVPFVFAKKDSRLASAIELFSARCVMGGIPDSELSGSIGTQLAEPFERRLRGLQEKAKITLIKPGDEPIVVTPVPPMKAVTLYPPHKFNMPGEPTYLKSYTLLAQPALHRTEGVPPSDFLVEGRNPHTLPAGSEVGILLHAILEKISFSEVQRAGQPADLEDYVRMFTKGTPFEQWSGTVAEIVYDALKTPFFEGVPPLADIHDFECYREMEFTYPAGADSGFDGYLKGVVDLFFRYGNKYYLVDWKSNWLGTGIENYQEDTMRQAMVDSDYLLQARIYREAIQRYLKILNQGELGGIAYVFLRGVSSTTGVVRL